MPIVDMPLEKLKTYTGSSPCPADIDAYWDKALSEMNAVDDNAEFIPYPLPTKIAECYSLYFTGTKGARLHAKFVKPRDITGEKIPAVLLFHGLGGACTDHVSMLRYAAQGYCVASLDTRGQGGYSEDAGGYAGPSISTPFIKGLEGEKEDLMMRDVFLDTALLAKVIMNLDYVDSTRVAVTGGSQGGGLSIACAALVPEIKLCAPVYPYLSDYKRVWDMDLAKGAYEGIRYYFRNHDPRHEHENEIFEKLGYIDIQNLAKRIRAKVFMGTGLMDTTCPPSTQFAAYNKITAEKQVKIYPDFGHEGLSGHDELIFTFFAENL